LDAAQTPHDYEESELGKIVHYLDGEVHLLKNKSSIDSTLIALLGLVDPPK
jgi:hypothetical protein